MVRCLTAVLLVIGLLVIGLLATAGPAVHAEDLAVLRTRALELVNQERSRRELPPLEADETLDATALHHARDMAERDYYAHVSPEGNTVMDRYRDAGGSRWRLVEENIARCAGCPPPATAAEVEELHQGWMDSPEHRASILAPGLDRFGFAIVAGGERGLYAVQTFAGPGQPRGLAEGETPAALPRSEQLARLLADINAARQEKAVPPLQASSALTETAETLLPPPDAEAITLDRSGGLLAALPAGDDAGWRAVSAVAGVCGGCGTTETAADIDFFRRQWLDNAEYRDSLLAERFSHLGFALDANGRGRKVAIAILGSRR